MDRMRGLAAGIGIVALTVVGIACGCPAPTVAGSITPDLRLTSEGVEYTEAEIVGTVSPDGSITGGGVPIDIGNMEVVATSTIHYPDHDAGAKVYRPTVGVATDVYTFQLARSVEASGEPGGTYISPATWTRWTSS